MALGLRRAVRSPRPLHLDVETSRHSWMKSWMVQKWMFGVSYQRRRQRLGHRHAAVGQQMPAHPPMAEIRERDDGVAADAQQMLAARRAAARVACSVWLSTT